MKNLETRLGVILLQRSTRSMQLTDEGQLYYDRCVGILAELEAAEAEITAQSKSLHGVLRIAAPLSFGVSHLSPALCAFMHTHTELSVELDLSDKRVDLIEEGFDLAIRIGEMDDSSLKARKLFDVQYVVCAAPAFFQKNGYPEKPKDLQELPGLCYGNLPNSSVWKYDGPNGKSGKVSVTKRLTSTNGDSLREAAISGLGVLCEPSFIVNSAVEKNLLCPVLTNYQWFGASVYVVYPGSRFLSLKSRRFIDFLVGRFAPNPYWESFIQR